MLWFEALLMANEPKKICLGPKALFFLSSHGTHLETYSYYENVPIVPNTTVLQLYFNLCNYIATIFSNIGEWSNTTILHLMQLYATISHLMQLYATILQLYATYATICNYIATYATILQLYATILQQFCMQLYCNYATICNMPYATCLSNDKSFKNSM